jgi:hypothetical protein
MDEIWIQAIALDGKRKSELVEASRMSNDYYLNDKTSSFSLIVETVGWYDQHEA